MGRLQQLEVENFKSYEGKQLVGPFDNFTCIIGPNGAGKSNMMDAISFVLGVQSRHLRSSHLKELVFRKDADSAPARRASVKLLYRLSENEIDNCAEGTEISFCRVISAAGVCSYKLNGKDVTFERYEETLNKIGVLVKARNFLVFQGDIESVASKSPQDLTKLLEQISGSDQYIAEYEELLRQKAEAEENTIFSMQKKKMFSTQCKEVKGQKDEAEYFQEKQDELSSVKTEHVLFQIWCVKAEMEGKQDAADDLREQLGVIKANEEELETELEEQKRDFAKASKELTTAEKNAATVVSKLDAVTPKLVEARAKLKSLQKRIAEQDKSKTRVQKDLQQQKDTVAGLQEDISALAAAERDLKAQLEASSDSSLKLDASAVKEYSRLREEVSTRIATQRSEELTIDLDLKSKQELLRRLQAQEESQAAEEQAGDKLIAECEGRQALLRGGVAACNTEQATLLASRETLAREMANSDTLQRQYSAELAQITEKLREVGDERRRGKQEEKMNEAITTMQRIFQGVHGRLADLCKPINRKYSQAISVAGGSRMDNVVVENKAVAQECIRYLRDQRVGTCVFLPLDNITVKPLPERLRSFGERYKPCVNLLKCEEQYKGVVSYAVGSTLVCDTLEEAQDLCFTKGERVKVVTLRGHSISKSGAMTGGSAASERVDRWEEREVDALRQRKAELESLLSQLTAQAPSRQQLLDLETRVRSLQSKVKLSETDIKVVEEKLAHLQQQKALRGENRARVRKEIDVLGGEVRTLERNLAQIHGRIQAVEAQVFADFSARLGITNIREYEQTALRKHQDLLQQQAVVTKQSAALSSQLAYELKRDFQGSLDRLAVQMSDAAKENDVLLALEQSLLHEEIKIRGLVKEANDKVNKLRHAKDELHQALKTAQIRRAEVLKDKESVTKKLAGEEILIERGRTQLHEILQKARTDEIALPTVNGAGDEETGKAGNAGKSSARGEGVVRGRDSEDLRWEGTQPQSLPQRQSASGRRGEGASDQESEGDAPGSETSGPSSSSAGGSRSTHFSQRDNPTVLRDSARAALVDLSSMRRKYKALTKARMEEVEREFSASIAEIQTELEKIQPNMHAAERYDGVVDKLRECNEQLEGTKEAVRELALRFEEVKKRRQQLFQECYTQVSEAMKTIYSDLTRSSKHPTGGRASLTLDNMDEPYLGGIRFTIMPPMKRLMDIQQLSGGEKTMAALALLFSIHSFRQAPFFVLDEVDAALDNVNVKKICNYIKQRSRDFQCVVISLKEMFFEHADCLIGICKDVESLSSQVLSLDLSKYAETPGGVQDYTDLASPSPMQAARDSGVGASGSGGPGSGARASYSGDRMGPGSGPENLLGKRKSPQGGAGAATAPALGVSAVAAGAGAAATSRRGGLRGSKAAVNREVIVEETEEDVEDSNAMPDVPDVIQTDPDVNRTIKVVTKTLGSGRDYSVHENEYPNNSTDVKQKMWMWLNKSNGGVIDLENFERGWKEDEPKKGKVLFSAVVTEQPYFEQFQRLARNPLRDRFLGFFGLAAANNQNNSGYDSDDDDYYINHANHKSKFGRGKRHSGKDYDDMITKWRLNTKAVIKDGNLGRGADTLQGKDIILEVFSKGTAATGWEEVEHRHTDQDGKEHVTKRDEKRETEWVDRVEFRLSVGGEMWAEWVVQGDTHYNPGSNCTIDSPLFTTQIEGGWFKKSTYTTTTKDGVDPALALLIAHLCYTEYSVAEIKRDLRPNTPSSPPRGFVYRAPAQNTLVYGGAHVKGQFRWAGKKTPNPLQPHA